MADPAQVPLPPLVAEAFGLAPPPSSGSGPLRTLAGSGADQQQEQQQPLLALTADVSGRGLVAAAGADAALPAATGAELTAGPSFALGSALPVGSLAEGSLHVGTAVSELDVVLRVNGKVRSTGSECLMSPCVIPTAKMKALTRRGLAWHRPVCCVVVQVLLHFAFAVESLPSTEIHTVRRADTPLHHNRAGCMAASAASGPA